MTSPRRAAARAGASYLVASYVILFVLLVVGILAGAPPWLISAVVFVVLVVTGISIALRRPGGQQSTEE